MPVEPTILVKKKDGTQVRMTMSEFRVYQDSLKHTSTSAPEHEEEKIKDVRNVSLLIGGTPADLSQQDRWVVEDEKTPPPLLRKVASPTRGGTNSLPTKIQSEALATAAPVKDIFIDEAIATKAQKHNLRPELRSRESTKAPEHNESFDHRSLLDDDENEEELAVHQHLPVIPSSQEEQFNDIIKKIKFPITDELLPRLRSLIISALKDIRSADQVKEYAVKKSENGGLGLTFAQVEELMEAINVRTASKHKNTESTKTQKTLKYNEEKNDNNDKTEIGQKLDRNWTENIDTKIDEKETRKLSARNTLQASMAGGGNWETGQSGRIYDSKPILQDVVLPKAKVETEVFETTGPIDELQEFTLVDFRRLSVRPTEAVEILYKKFTDLRAESYMFYMKGKAAWYESPLYQLYLGIVRKAIEQKQRIDEIFSGQQTKDQLTKEEFTALSEMMERI
jgi:hypothetical protein